MLTAQKGVGVRGQMDRARADLGLDCAVFFNFTTPQEDEHVAALWAVYDQMVHCAPISASSLPLFAPLRAMRMENPTDTVPPSQPTQSSAAVPGMHGVYSVKERFWAKNGYSARVEIKADKALGISTICAKENFATKEEAGRAVDKIKTEHMTKCGIEFEVRSIY